MKLIILSVFLISLVFCNNPTETTVSKSRILSASVVSGYHKICRKGVTVDSFPITPDDSAYQLIHNWDTIIIKSDTLFWKCFDSGAITYTGYTYKTINDSISLYPLGVFDSMFVLDTVTYDSQVITLEGSPSEIYMEYAKVDLYYKYFSSWIYGGWWVTIINNKELMESFNLTDSASGSFFRLVFK